MKKLSGLLVLLAVVGCAHHRDVRAGVDGVNRVAVIGNGEGDGERDAIGQANHYCKEEFHKRAVFLEEKTAYTGSMDEETNKTVRTASKVAGVVGTGVSVFGGGRKDRGAGGVLMGAGGVGAVATGNNYKTEMRFQWQ